MTKSKPRTLGLLISVACAMVFGLWPSCVRAAYADGANPAFAILITTAARALTLYLFCLLTHKPVFTARDTTKLAVRGGFFQAVALITALASLAYIPGPVALTLCFTHTIMLLFFLAWRGEAKLDALTVFATLAALVGLTFVVNLWSATGQVSPIGIGLALLSAVATMSRLYVFGQMTKTRNPAVVGAETFLMALAFIIVTMLFKAPHLPASLAGWGWIALGSASLAVGTFGMFYAIALIGSFQFSLLLKMEPVFTALFAMLLIHEKLGLGQYAGIAMVVGSLATYQVIEHKLKNVS
jgi:drug/metabolite transporter (DMT)-like permease